MYNTAYTDTMYEKDEISQFYTKHSHSHEIKDEREKNSIHCVVCSILLKIASLKMKLCLVGLKIVQKYSSFYFTSLCWRF